MTSIPKLRFKEFNEEWKSYLLKTISEKLNVGFVGTCEKFYTDKENGIKLIRTGNLVNGGVTNRKLKYITAEFHNKNIKSQVCKDDILIARHGSNGQACLYLEEEVVNCLNIVILRNRKDISNSIFLINQINSPLVQQQIASRTAGSTQGVINTKEIAKLNISIPSKQEQEKIASFLTSVDVRIAQLTKKESLLQDYKKGVMQKIFNQEIRFKDDDGSEFPDWEENILNDFLIPTLREILKPKENYLAIGIRSHCKGTFQKPDSQPHKIAMDKLYQVKENDLIVNITFAWEGAIAIVKKEDKDGLVSHRFPTYTFNPDLAIVDYFRYVIIQKKFRVMLDLISPGGAGRNRVMSKKDFLKLKWKMPSVNEQIKIANFLSSIDKKIELANIELQKTKEFKKALLQQMFV